MSLPFEQDGDTAFAPAARADESSLRLQRAAFLSDPTAASMLEAMPGPAMVLNSHRQILAVNGQLVRLVQAADLDSILGKRPGELVQCIRAKERPGGCGTTEHCSTCGAANAIVEALATCGRSERECRIVTQGASDGGALDFRVLANHLRFGEESCVILGLTDISGEKRRQVLERVFFHDLLNAVGGMHGLAELLVEKGVEPELESECKHDIHRLSGTVIDEIRAHREMLAAERGELAARLEDVGLGELVDEVIHLYRHHPVAEGRSIELSPSEPVTMRTDPTMLRRVLGNLIKNALEAIPIGAKVTVGFEPSESEVRFFVRNPGFIPRDVQLQIFQRSFSTKSSVGRGIGTYSVRLFVERHLGGSVGFVSDEERGTEFHVTLPRYPKEQVTDQAA